MKFKFDLDLDENELSRGLQSEINKSLAIATSEAVQHGRELARSRFKGSGEKRWLEGFKTHKVNDNFYVISVDGKLANWMEDGIQTGEISKAIMEGNRAQHNKAEGKKYVDVPFFKDADAGGTIHAGGGTRVNIRAFADADSMVKSLERKTVKMSDFANKRVKEEQRVVQRVQDVIKSVDPKSENNTRYLTIRRVTENSTWPKTPFKGAKILEDLEAFIEKRFDEILRQVM